MFAVNENAPPAVVTGGNGGNEVADGLSPVLSALALDAIPLMAFGLIVKLSVEHAGAEEATLARTLTFRAALL